MKREIAIAIANTWARAHGQPSNEQHDAMAAALALVPDPDEWAVLNVSPEGLRPVGVLAGGVLYIVGREPPDESGAGVSVERWPGIDDAGVSVVLGECDPRASGPGRDRRWTFDFGGGRAIEFTGSANGGQDGPDPSDSFARSLAREIGWNAP